MSSGGQIFVSLDTLRPPIGTKPSGRADPGKPPPASWQRPARPPARRKNAPPPCSLQPKGANAQTPIRLRPRTSLNRLHGRAASSGVASSVKPPSRMKCRMDSTAPSGWNAIRYGNGVERTIRVRANRSPSLRPPTRAHGRAASQIAPSVPAGPTSRAPSGRDDHPHRCWVWQRRQAGLPTSVTIPSGSQVLRGMNEKPSLRPPARTLGQGRRTGCRFLYPRSQDFHLEGHVSIRDGRAFLLPHPDQTNTTGQGRRTG